MSVATKNPFAILDEESSQPSAPTPPPAAAAPPAPPASRGNQKSRGGPASRGGRYYARGGAGNNAAGRDAAAGEEPPVGAEAPKRRFDGERGERRGRGGRGGPRGRGRTFDRHSATGKTDSEKKVHQSWGGDDGNTELKVEEAATVDAAAETTGMNDWAGGEAVAAADDAWGAPAATDGAPATPAGEGERPEGRRREREPEEEDNTLTLEQYLAQQKEKESSVVPKLEVRKANEGADDKIWEGAAPLKKDEEEAYFAGKTKSAPKSRGEKKEKVFIEIEARFERPARGGPRGRGGDRGDRGDRGRGGRGRGGPGRGRGGANGNAATPVVNVADTTAFPSLS
ncbi:hypothetical protein BV22DRAFT_1027780 [Leucogyrophana mollusca]|uniref:Uncharacterized protein n=1 Tax=Leucogyrophana mollusca TaxID=85980 RepID=A0ACB8BZF8_9AGAM|nr:hypothetical protein BV22DRAFT_1027780 [Leucogyrophana mollusca]